VCPYSSKFNIDSPQDTVQTSAERLGRVNASAALICLSTHMCPARSNACEAVGVKRSACAAAAVGTARSARPAYRHPAAVRGRPGAVVRLGAGQRGRTGPRARHARAGDAQVCQGLGLGLGFRALVSEVGLGHGHAMHVQATHRCSSRCLPNRFLLLSVQNTSHLFLVHKQCFPMILLHKPKSHKC